MRVLHYIVECSVICWGVGLDDMNVQLHSREC